MPKIDNIVSPAEAAATVPGLLYIPDIITDVEAQLLLWDLPSGLFEEPEGQSTKSKCASAQLHIFPPLPTWLTEILPRLPSEWRNRVWGPTGGVFDSAIVQRYLPGEGIMPHTDLAMFGDGVAILSLLSDAKMQFSDSNGTELTLVLQANSLLLLSGSARYEWTHGIRAVQSERVSITMRRVAQTAFGE